MEKFLYFTTTVGDINDTQEVALYPVSNLTSFNCPTATTTVLNFVPRDGTFTTEDVVTLEHADGAHKSVIHSVVQLVNADNNKSPFIVAADKKNGVFNIEGVTSVTVSSAD
jgi:hypothetical protein